MLTRRGMAGLFLTSALTQGAVLRAARAQVTQAWPSRHVLLIVPFAPGGAPDVIVRVIANRLSELWGQVKDRLEQLGASVVGSTPAELGAFLKSEIDK